MPFVINHDRPCQPRTCRLSCAVCSLQNDCARAKTAANALQARNERSIDGSIDQSEFGVRAAAARTRRRVGGSGGARQAQSGVLGHVEVAQHPFLAGDELVARA